jgi:thiosulfate reductase cytochrome b subunit
LKDFNCLRKDNCFKGKRALTRKGNDYLRTFNRLLVWPTLVLLIIVVISGFGITNPRTTSELTGGLFTQYNSLYWHLNLVVPVLILLMIHMLIGLKTALTRRGVKEARLLNAVLVALGLFVAVLIILARFLVF